MLSCSKKEHKAVVKQNFTVSNTTTTKDSITKVIIQKDKVKDTLDGLAPHETTCIKKFTTSYKFSAFKVKMYTGELVAPNFEGNPYACDKEYVDFITEGCKNNGINFAGRYTIIQKSCGCMCEHIFIVDRSNGEIFTEGMLATAEGEGRFGFTYKKDSKMIIVDSGLFTDDNFTHYICFYKTAPEIYVWKSKRFKKLQ